MTSGWPHLEPHLGPADQRLGGVVQVHGVAPHHPGLPLRRLVALRLPARLTLHQVPHAARLHAPLQPVTARQPGAVSRAVGVLGTNDCDVDVGTVFGSDGLKAPGASARLSAGEVWVDA
jgi:hypothetical protein